jgi:2-amino-4-hydroxy-6-hydroxymethyldihydropteridine diphosphokinase
MRTGIALGSNLGDRYAILAKAIQDLRLMHEEGEFLVSSFLETEPVDCPPGSPLFLNAAVEMDTSLDPLILVEKLQKFEVLSGRLKSNDYHAPRTLDLDILYVGELIVKLPSLQLPHPRIRERFFVLKPLSQIRPDLRLPQWDCTALEYLLNFYKNNFKTLIDILI